PAITKCSPSACPHDKSIWVGLNRDYICLAVAIDIANQKLLSGIIWCLQKPLPAVTKCSPSARPYNKSIWVGLNGDHVSLRISIDIITAKLCRRLDRNRE